MKREVAMELLMNWGWNEDGAEAIVDTAIEDGLLDEMTEEDLKELSEDYADR